MPVNKVRRKGSYAPLSAHYYKDDAIADAGEAAELLYVRGLAFCADVLSDGFISDRQLERFVGVGMRDATKRAKKLGEVGLWERVAGGWQVSGWLKWNRSKDDITDLNRADADRKGSKPAQPEDEIPPPTDADAPPDSDPTPNGIRTESAPASERTPNGIPPRAHGRAQTPLHSTPLHSSAADAAAPPTAKREPSGAVAKAITEEFMEIRPMSKFVAVQGVVKKALASGYASDAIRSALRRLAAAGFSVTVETLRIELDKAPGQTRLQVLHGGGDLTDEQVDEILGPETPPNPPADIAARGLDAVKAWGREHDPKWREQRRQQAMSRLARTAQ